MERGKGSTAVGGGGGVERRVFLVKFEKRARAATSVAARCSREIRPGLRSSFALRGWLRSVIGLVRASSCRFDRGLCARVSSTSASRSSLFASTSEPTLRPIPVYGINPLLYFCLVFFVTVIAARLFVSFVFGRTRARARARQLRVDVSVEQ